VRVKGRHAAGAEATDWLVLADGSTRSFKTPRLGARHRGTGCALASGIAAGLAAGLSLNAACERAKGHVTELLQRAG
jgi:hydroxymethylpyrimidine/phosphomethylpyrimidine kinase